MKQKLKKAIDNLNKILFTNQEEWNYHRLVLYSLVCISSVYAAFIEFKPKEISSYAAKKQELGKFTTLIPKGYTLIPISIANSKSLDSMFGQFGRVDLFYRAESVNAKLKLIARQVKLMRAPKNPSVFAVLCKREMTPLILKYPGPFTVSLLSDKETGTQIVKPRVKSRIEVDYLDET